MDPEPPDVLFYDGGCGLCHRAVRFVVRFDRDGSAYRFAPLHGETFRTMLGGQTENLPDSLVVRTPSGQVLTRSDGGLRMLRRLGGGFVLLAQVLGLLPRALRDAVYDGVARIRHRLFAKPQDVCPVLPPPLRARFLP